MSRPRVALWAVFSIALGLRFLAQVAYGFYDTPETWEYDQMARDLLAGRGYTFRFLGTDWQTFGLPAFPVTLAVLHALGGGPDAYWLIGISLAVMSAALSPLSYAIARRLFDERAGLLAAGIVAVNPALLLFSARVHELNLDVLLAAAILVAVLDQARSPGASGIRLGVLSGVATLARPTVTVFALVAFGLIALQRPRRSLVVAGALMLALAAPWTVRNAAVLGTGFVSAPLNCVTLWMGNNPYATGGPLTRDGRSVLDAASDEHRFSLSEKTEVEQGRVFCAEAFTFLAAQPLWGAGWWAEKFVYFWWFPPHAGIFYPRGWIDAYRVIYALEAGLALLGALLVWGRGWRLGLGFVALQLFMISAVQSLGYVEGRHRLVLEPTLAALAGIGLAGLIPPLHAMWCRIAGWLRRRVTVGRQSVGDPRWDARKLPRSGPSFIAARPSVASSTMRPDLLPPRSCRRGRA